MSCSSARRGMAQTREPRKAERFTGSVGRQAADAVWSPRELLDVLKKPPRVRKQELLREVGILEASGKLAKRYRSWGNRVSRTSFPGSGA